ncbi:AraC family transcriptional regulator [Paraburkholderia fungorum]|jgi:AraC family ethanolamine operon transcriptional activator|uniref:helix-turn-helix domain-containing protein n=1 Tax=Paraburkholderia fungorum TaxID=134537 RepID=UPI000D059872|nr:helix-turn-helix domain-containing protein [Paraburkholderia fungorum]PRZ55852.1 AraC family transcriptional regulator [Paraburkholderia fungorum]
MSSSIEITSETRDGEPLLAQAVGFCAYSDVEEQARAFDGWSLDYTQISAGVFHGSSSTISLGAVRLLVESLDKVILQHGAVPSDRLAVAVPLELEGHARMCGERSGRDSLHVFSSLPEFEFFSPDRHLLVNVEIDATKLTSTPMRALAESARASAVTPVVQMTAETADSLRGLLRQTLAASAQGAAGACADAESQIALLERSILYAISEVLSSAALESAKEPLRPTRHWGLVNSVRDLLQDPATCPLSIAELCVQLGLSRRTIQYAFQEALNLNPVAYLRAVRLNHVRRQLRLGASVTAAATEWGFWHLGSFAQDYRQMFGELPSVTSKRHSRSSDAN